MGLIEIIKPLTAVLSSAVNKSQQHPREKILGNAQNQTRGLWVRSKNANSVINSPQNIIVTFLFVLIEVK